MASLQLQAKLISAGFLVGQLVLGAATPEHVTVTPAAPPSESAAGFSAAGEMTSDGRFALFYSSAPNLTEPATTGGWVNVFLSDRRAGTNILISVDVAGTGGASAHCSAASVSEDGRFVVFQSGASNLVADDADGAVDIFVRDTALNSTRRISAPYEGAAATARKGSSNPTMSRDGGRIFFASQSADIAPGVAGTMGYLFDRAAGTNRAIAPQGFAGALWANPVIAGAGNFVFAATTTSTSGTHLYGYDLQNETTMWVSSNALKIPRPASSATCALQGVSGNGRFVLYTAEVSPPTATHLIRHDLDPDWSAIDTNATRVIATNISRRGEGLPPEGDAAISTDGRFIAFSTGGNVYRYDGESRTYQLATVGLGGGPLGSTNVSVPLMSSDGRYIAFQSAATNLVEGEDQGFTQLYLRDMVESKTTLISRGHSGFGIANGFIIDVSISDDGRKAVFSSASPELTGDEDGNGGLDCFIWEAVQTPQVSLLSKALRPTQSPNPFRLLSLSAQPMNRDGQVIVFSGIREEVSPFPQVWLRDRKAGSTVLISRSPDGSGVAAPAHNALITPDGRWIAYESAASNLVAGLVDTNRISDIFLHDREASITRQVSTNGRAGNLKAAAVLQALSPNGRYVWLTASAQSVSFDHPFLWDRESNSSKLLIRSAAGEPINCNVGDFAFSPDSRWAVFHIKTGSPFYYTDPTTGVETFTYSSLIAYDLEHDVIYPRPANFNDVLSRWSTFSGDGLSVVTTAVLNRGLAAIGEIDLKSPDLGFIPYPFSSAQSSSRAEISFDGKRVAYEFGTTFAANGILDSTTGGTNLFLEPGTKLTKRPAITPDGRLVVFESLSDVSGHDDRNRMPDIYVHDVMGRTNRLLTAGNGASLAHRVSPDGSTVLVGSAATDFGWEDTNGELDLFVFPLVEGPAAAPNILASPRAAQREPGGSVWLKALVEAGPESPSLQWFKGDVALVNDTRISGANSDALDIQGLVATDSGVYRLRARNSQGEAWSAETVLTVGAVIPAEAILTVERSAGGIEIRWPAARGDFTLEATGAVGSSATWTEVLPRPTAQGEHFLLSVPAAEEARFYRLRK